jgi:radical SAM superfamily enzyme YgiQ (UPF0313 family)
VSHECEDQEIVRLADHTICGEADLAFAALCRELLNPAESRATPPQTFPAPLPDLTRLRFPYEEYTDRDIANRVIYVEASRGCPFSCEFCLSSLDVAVRVFPLGGFLGAMSRLLQRGSRQFKFVDRTFNLNLETSRSILRFFRENWRDGLFLHFEMIPDRLPEALREEIAWFPPGAVQFEIGIQSFNPAVCERIHRRQNFTRLDDNLRFLREQTGVHLHVDLIAGLPGETLESFASGFDRLVSLGPQEIQFGILKRLRGTPISRHDPEWGMRYNPAPPYEILESRLLDFATMQRLRRFSRYWDLVANSGRFVSTLPLLWCGQSPFNSFLAFSDWIFARTGQTHAIALERLAEHLFRWLVEERGVARARVVEAVTADWRRMGYRDSPGWLAGEPLDDAKAPRGLARHARRQERHRAGDRARRME